jgi:hypothetical protein
LVTLLTVYTLRSRAGFLSHRQRSWDSPFGAFSSRTVSRSITTQISPLTMSHIGAPAALAVGRPNERWFLGFDPCESPSRLGKGLACQPPDAPLGFLPSRAIYRRPRPGFRPDSSLALPIPDGEPSATAAPQSINQPPARPIRLPQRTTTTAQGHPSRVLAPTQSRTFGQPYLRAMSSPLIVPGITARQPMVFGGT